jgi:hypothetical protein
MLELKANAGMKGNPAKKSGIYAALREAKRIIGQKLRRY